MSEALAKAIRGAGGGKAGGKGRTPIEAPDSLRSVAYAQLLDLVSEGEIYGFANQDNPLSCVFFDETPVANDDGTYNFKNFTIDSRVGSQVQDPMEGFAGVESETAIGVQLKHGAPWTRTFANTNLTAVRVRLSLPALMNVDTKTGDTNGSIVNYKIELSTDSGAFTTVLEASFNGKASNEYERSHRISLPVAATGWIIRVTRLTPDSTSQTLQNQTWVASVTEIIDAKLRMPMSAYIGVIIDAEQFGRIPARAYRLKGRLIRVPSNYEPQTRTYVGVWDGTFKTAYSNNPAWVFYDMATHERYGLGHLVPAQLVDKWALYQIAQYCDEPVPDGFGGLEPRFTANVYLQSQDDALRVMQNLASIFRGIIYAAGGTVVPVGDMPDDARYTYGPGNVIDKKFTYTGSPRKARHTVALVSWNDMGDMGRAKIAYVEDREGIARYGIQQTEVIAIGCTSRGQAIRMGRSILTTERYETDLVTFGVGLDGTLVNPGRIIRIADPTRAGRRTSGRIKLATLNSVTVDVAPLVEIGNSITVALANGETETRVVSSINNTIIGVSQPFSSMPVVQGMWVVESPALKAQTFRVLSVTERPDGLGHDVVAIQHVPGKYAYIEEGLLIEEAPISDRPNVTLSPPTNIMVALRDVPNTKTAQQIASVSWTGVADATGYTVSYRHNSGNWVDVVGVTSTLVDLPALAVGVLEVRVTATSPTTRSLPAYAGPFDIEDEVLPALDWFGVAVRDGGMRYFSFGYNAPPTNYEGVEIRYMEQDPDALVPVPSDPELFEAFWMGMTQLGVFASDFDTVVPGKGTWTFVARPVDVAGNWGDPSVFTETLGNTLADTFTDVSETIADLTTDVNDRIDHITDVVIPGINTTIDDLTTDTNDRITDITDVVIPGIVGDVDTINNVTIPGINDTITDLTNSTDAAIAGLHTTVTTLETNTGAALSQLDDDIAALGLTVEGNRQNLQTQVDTMQGVVSSHTAQIADIFGADEWSSATAYPAGDFVKSGGVLYRSLQAVPAGTPLTDEAYWEPLGDYSSLGEAVGATIGRVNVIDSSLYILDGNLTATIQELSALTAVVEDKADITALNAIGVRVTETEDSLEVHGEDITALKAKVGTEVLGPELIPDPDFNGPTLAAGWLPIGSTATISNGELKLVSDAGVSRRAERVITGLTAGATYRFTIRAKRGAVGTEQRIRSWVGANWPDTALTSAYADYTHDLVVPATSVTLRIYINNATQLAGQELYIDRVSVRKVENINLASAVSGLTIDLQEVDGRVTAQAQQLTALGVTVGENTADISSIQTAYADADSALASDISALDVRVGANEASITNIQTAYADADSALASDITALEVTVNDPETGVAATASGLSALTTEVSILDGVVTSQGQDIVSLESAITDPSTGLNATANGLSALTTTVTQQGQNIGSNSSAITALENTVNDPETGVAATSNAVAALTSDVGLIDGRLTAAAADVVALDARLDTAEGTLGGHSTAISGLQTTVLQHGDSIQAISSDVTALQAAIGEEVLGPELVSIAPSVLSAVTSTQVADGLKLTATAGAGSYCYGQWDIPAANLVAGADYRVTIVAKRGAQGTKQSVSRTGLDNGQSLPLTSTSFQTITYVAQPIANTTVRLYVYAHPSTGAVGDEVVVQSVSLRKIESVNIADAINGLTVDVQQVGEDITAVAEDLTALDAIVKHPTTGLAATGSAVQSLSTKVGTFPTGGFTSASQAVVSLNNAITDPVTGLQANANAISGLSSTVTTIDGRVTTNAQDIVSLETVVNDPATGLSATSNALAALTTRVTTAEGEIDAVAQDVVDLGIVVDGKATTSALSALTTRVTTNEGSITAINSDITQLETDLAGKASAGALNALVTEVEDLGETVTSQGSAITSLQNTVNNPTTGVTATASGLSALNTRVGATPTGFVSFAAKITSLDTAIDGKASSSALSTLTSEVEDIDGIVTSHGQAITSLTNTVAGKADASAVTTLDNRVGATPAGYTSFSLAYTGLKNTVDGKASSAALTTLDSRVGATPTGFSSFSAAITSLTNTVNGKASAAALTTLENRVGATPSGSTTFSAAITSLRNDVAGKASIGVTDSLLAQIQDNDGDIFAQGQRLTALEGTINNPTTGHTAIVQAVDDLEFDMYATGGKLDIHAFQLNGLNSAVFDSNGNVQLASASAFNSLQTFVGTTPQGGGQSLSQAVAGVSAAVFNTNTGLQDRVTVTETMTASINNKLEGVYGFTVDVNGRASGMKHIATGATSGTVFRTDTFAVMPPNSTGERFEISGSQQRIYDANGVLRVFIGI